MMAAWKEALWQTAPALAALPVFLAVHVALWQVLPRDRKGVCYLVLTASAAFAAVLVFWPAPVPAHAGVSLPLYAFEVVLYMHLYFGIDRSLSVRMLVELLESETGSLTREALNRKYAPHDMVQRRAAVLLAKGLIEEKGNRYVCTARGRILVRLALAGKAVYGLRATG
jgi:hypothetical protein